MYSRQVDRAAQTIASAGLFSVPSDPSDGATTPPDVPASATVPEFADLGEEMTSMLIAQRAFAAQLRVLQSADEMLKETVDAVKR
jgi:flagellar basal body rod protein FlgC